MMKSAFESWSSSSASTSSFLSLVPLNWLSMFSAPCRTLVSMSSCRCSWKSRCSAADSDSGSSPGVLGNPGDSRASKKIKIEIKQDENLLKKIIKKGENLLKQIKQGENLLKQMKLGENLLKQRVFKYQLWISILTYEKRMKYGCNCKDEKTGLIECTQWNDLNMESACKTRDAFESI